MKAYPYMPGVPAAGHIANGYWHPGKIDRCPKCPPDQRKVNEILHRFGQYKVEGNAIIVTDPEIRRGHIVERPIWLKEYDGREIREALRRLQLQYRILVQIPGTRDG